MVLGTPLTLKERNSSGIRGFIPTIGREVGSIRRCLENPGVSGAKPRFAPAVEQSGDFHDNSGPEIQRERGNFRKIPR